jgi:hypothetical protein
MDALGSLVGVTIGVQTAAIGLLVLYVWMVVDAIVRDERDYPGDGSNEKLVWILLMIFVHFTAALYFFMVFCAAKRGGRVAGYTTASSAPSAAPVA